MPTSPEWWNWDLSFTGHAELRMEQRGVTEVEVRAMLERATGFEASVVAGRFMIQTRRGQNPWIVVVEPDAEAGLLVVVTVYGVSQ
jgi:hypothetical protein